MRRRQPPNKQKPQTAKQQENERLAQALRDNLNRRKVQARARALASVNDVGGTITPDEKDTAEWSKM